MTTCLISFGANLGEPQVTLSQVIQLLGSVRYVNMGKVSRARHYRSAGGPREQPDFLNAVIRVETRLPPAELLQTLQSIEAQLGRQRTDRWGPRLVDLDLVMYGDEQSDQPDLTLPHPRMCFRRFVLEPAVEVGSEIVHPTLGLSLQALLDHLNAADNYIALVGADSADRREIVVRLCDDRPHIAVLNSADRKAEPGRSADTEIEFFQTCSEALRRAERIRPQDAYLLSDFWCEQALVGLGHCCTDQQVRQVKQLWEDQRALTPKPKLLVVLQDGRRQNGQAGSADDAFRSALREYLVASPVGPVLFVSRHDRDWVVTEILAAIDAM